VFKEKNMADTVPIYLSPYLPGQFL